MLRRAEDRAFGVALVIHHNNVPKEFWEQRWQQMTGSQLDRLNIWYSNVLESVLSNIYLETS